MTTAANNGQRKTQTVHVALPHRIVRQIKALARDTRRTLNAQTALLIEEALQNGNQK